MAVFPNVKASEQPQPAPQNLSGAVPGTQPANQEPVTVSLDQPDPVVRKSVVVEDGDEEDADALRARRAPLRRDSMRRREALLKGKEGTRRRQRWENDNFLNNPSYVAPSADDFMPRPLHPTRVVRYEFATLWDPSNPAKYGYSTAHHIPSAKKSNDEKRVPKNLKDRLKRSKGAMDLLKSLEEEVRNYAASLWGCVDEYCHSTTSSSAAVPTAMSESILSVGTTVTDDADMVNVQRSVVEEEMKDSEDEEIVFIPRMKTVSLDNDNNDNETGKQTTGREIYIPVMGPPLEKSVFQALQDDQGASFGRWLVHSIALYYGLRSWSVTEGNPAMRIAFVGAQPNERKKRKSGALIKHPKSLPRPLWMML